MEISITATLISAAIWLFIWLKWIWPDYKEEGKYDLGGLLGMLIIVSVILFTVTLIITEFICRGVIRLF